MIKCWACKEEKKPTPGVLEFIKMLKDSLAYCEEADDQGSIDFEMARWQHECTSWEPILDEDGGI
tara:strand:- start:574 stop:768 length:195 start_codon:yes stop_codon:yes gene_type:complete